MFYITDELYHHGILGQKWGVRRYQNYDGSYTQAGLKRYNEAKDLSARALDAYNAGKISKRDLRYVERNEGRAYRHLKTDKKADKGKALINVDGDSITKNRTKNHRLRRTAFLAGANPVAVYTGMQAPLLGYTFVSNNLRRRDNRYMRAYKHYDSRSIQLGNDKVKALLDSKLGETSINDIKLKSA